MRTIFTANDQLSGHCYIINGPLTLESEFIPPERVEGGRMLVGTLEYFLRPDQLPDPPVRLLTVRVDDTTDVQSLPPEQMGKIRTNYELGFACNAFLSRTLTVTNRRLAGLNRLSPEELKYQRNAQTFARFIDDIQRLGETAKLPPLLALAQARKKHPVYLEGRALNRDVASVVIDVPAQPVGKFIERYPEGGQICRAGEEGLKMYVLLKGSVAVSAGGTYICSLSKPGEIFGEIALFLSSPRTADIVAEEETLLQVVSNDNLKEFHSSHPQLFSSIAQALASRVVIGLNRIAARKAAAKNPAKRQAQGQRGRQELSDLFRDLDQLCNEIKDVRLSRLWQRYVHHFQAGH